MVAREPGYYFVRANAQQDPFMIWRPALWQGTTWALLGSGIGHCDVDLLEIDERAIVRIPTQPATGDCDEQGTEL